MSSWWRRNRWALLALPFVLVLAVAVSSYRILTVWNPWQLTDPQTAPAGESVSLSDELSDGADGYRIDLELAAGPARQVTSVPDAAGEAQPVPEQPGTVVWQTDLTVTADPETILRYCKVRLVDEQGRQTTYSTIRPGVPVSGDPCVPAEAPGPEPDLGLDLEPLESAPRPPTYTVPVLFRTTDDFVPARMDIWWETPRYAALELTTEEDGR